MLLKIPTTPDIDFPLYYACFLCQEIYPKPKVAGYLYNDTVRYVFSKKWGSPQSKVSFKANF
jgi:hypothetical protein